MLINHQSGDIGSQIENINLKLREEQLEIKFGNFQILKGIYIHETR